MGTTALEDTLRNNQRRYLTEVEVEALLDGTPDSRYGKVKRLLAQGKLLHIRRGLYMLTDKAGFLGKPHPFELAQYIYGPSYISLESALSFHNLIPEAVYTTTSVCIKRSKIFQTPLGEFSYLHVPGQDFYFDVKLITENSYRFFMAKPWKAICDYVFCYKKSWDSLEPLAKSLRINLDDLPYLPDGEIEMLDEYYHHTRLTRFLKGAKRHFRR